MKWALLFIGLALSVRAQFAVDEWFRPAVYTNAAGETLSYRVSAPQVWEPGKKYPLILFMHGSGECGTDNRLQLKNGLPALMKRLLLRQERVIVVAPQCPPTDWWVHSLAFRSDYAMLPHPAPSLAKALDICRQFVDAGMADSNRLYMVGLSLGGFATWDAIEREPDLFAAAVPVCGGGDIRRVALLKKLPIWVFHGKADKNVPVDCSRRMVEALRQAGNKTVRYTEYPNGGHAIWDQAYTEPEFLDWLFAQTRTKKPWWRFW